MYNLCENYEHSVNVSTRTDRVLKPWEKTRKTKGKQSGEKREEGKQKETKGAERNKKKPRNTKEK